MAIKGAKQKLINSVYLTDTSMHHELIIYCAANQATPATTKTKTAARTKPTTINIQGEAD